MRHPATFLLAVFSAAGLCGAPPAEVEIVCVDEKATGYGTFQSHNQKVLANRGGIFMSHIRSRNEAYTAQQWRLSRSTDGGRTFQTIHEATNATNPAVIETDEDANVYLVRPDFGDGNSYLYFFAAVDQYQKPRVTPIPGSAAGKFAMAYDAARRQLYYCSQNHTFHVVALDGAVKQSTALLKAGKRALMQYPLLDLDDAGTLHGSTWTDHAVSGKIEKLYALGGCRSVTADGFIIGSFTDNLTSSTEAGGTAKVNFFRICGLH